MNRNKLLKTRCKESNFTGRMVIIPDETIKIDEVIISKDIADQLGLNKKDLIIKK